MTVSEKLSKAGYKFVKEVALPNLMLPVSLHELSPKLFIMVEREGHISIVDKDLNRTHFPLEVKLLNSLSDIF